MLKYYFNLAFLIYSLSNYAQTTIANQSFETNGDNWETNFSTPACIDDDLIWNYQTQLESINPSHGEQFWGIKKLNGSCSTSNFETITLQNIDISAYYDVSFTFEYNVFEFDSGDDIKYELIYDNQSQGEILLFEGAGNLSTNGWQTETISIPNSVSNVKIIISIKQRGLADYAGIDNINLMGLPIISCSQLMISEYIEGTSSDTHRNNFIEIYNPTNSEINLENYNITTYKNANLNPTGEIALIGTISPFGTYLIEDDKENLNVEANISSNTAVMDFTGNDKITLRKNEEIIDIIGVIGTENTFAEDVTLRRKSNVQNPNNQYDESEWDIYGLEDITNLNLHISTCSGAIPEIEVLGNTIEIIDGSTTTSVINYTHFGSIDTNSGDSIIKEFIIKNIGNDNLNVSNIQLSGNNADNFTLIGNSTFNVAPTESSSFEIEFIPNSQGIKTAILQIDNNDASENPFTFVIQGEGAGNTNSPLMITQYYEGEGNNKWIEITNISENTTQGNQYYLALYGNEKAESPTGKTPSAKINLPVLASKQILKIRSNFTNNFPSYAIDGTEINSSVCNFNGNDIIIISTSNDEYCWENKVDIIGNSSNWGENISFVRKYGCEKVETSTGFNIEDWFQFDISEINSATAGYNYRIGEHYIGETKFESGTWDNGEPENLRSAIINDNYFTESNGNFEIYNLEIKANNKLTISANNYISITNNLTVNGSLEVLNEGSLIMINDVDIVNNGIINIHKTTTKIKKYDYTYWSSPIENASFATEFIESPQNYIYEFNTTEFVDNNNDELDDDDPPAWQKAVGNMTNGKGYAILAPITEPFEDTQTVIFNGTVNNGLVEIPLQLSSKDNNENNDWNLVGNPYPSAIDADLFLNNPINQNLLSGTIYFWTHNTPKVGDVYTSNDYASYLVNIGGTKASEEGEIPSGSIASCQGFFVEALQEGKIQFTNDMRTETGNNNFFKQDIPKKKSIENENKIWLNLYNDKGAFSQILIGFMDNASEKVERGFDAIRFNGNEFISFYSLAEEKKLAIQSTSPIDENSEIKIGFSSMIEKAVNLKIKIDKTEGTIGSQAIFLFDKFLEITHNLQESDYEFTVNNPGKFEDRFIIKFQNSALDIEDFNNGDIELIVKTNNNQFEVSTTKNNMLKKMIIYDILGRKVLEKDLNKTVFTLDKNVLQNNGVYILNVKLENGASLSKKVIFK